MTISEEVAKRRDTWETAKEMVSPIIEQHGLETEVIGGLFSKDAVYSKVSQHLDSIERVARWLLNEQPITLFETNR